MPHARRASTPEEARRYRQAGHDDALEFAKAIGLERDYANDRKAKKDVIDPSGDAHSLKSGQKKWQIFLYRRDRFLEDYAFQSMNGIGQLLVHCIDAFPPSYEEFRKNPEAAKARLRTPMKELRDRFQRKALLRAFLSKAIFNSGEVDYLTVKHGGNFHVFWNKDVINTMGTEFEVINSKGDQKVLFRWKGNNVGELEIRADSPKHYAEVRFNMLKKKAMELLFTIDAQITSPLNPRVLVYGSATKRFGRWKSRGSDNHTT
ncbi:MAG TPA: hypothetical protein VNL38_01255 [Candidatus Nitrosotenuis sp.]|nr:hypothetical protein [Candidatus Nitrosotenuis sp.]